MINITKGDITKVNTQVIVNAANKYLIAGGGVDGCIHKAAGPQLQEYLNVYKDLVYPNPDNKLDSNNKFKILTIKVGTQTNSYKVLKTGQAILTPAFNLEKTGPSHIIHCVGPVFMESSNAYEELASCYKEALKICDFEGFKSISFPSISTGIYRFPLSEAVEIALDTLNKYKNPNLECQMVLFDDETYNAYKNYTQ